MTSFSEIKDWEADQPSIFKKVKDLTGEDEIKEALSKKKKNIVFVYHPACPWSLKAAPEFEKFFKKAKKMGLTKNVGIYGINTSWNDNRNPNVMKFIGLVKGIPTINLIEDGQFEEFNENANVDGLIKFISKNKE